MSVHENCLIYVGITRALALLTNRMEIISLMLKFTENLMKLKLSPLEQKILMSIQPGIICTNLVNFYRPGQLVASYEAKFP